ncbi:MAG TPA: pyridoxamine 5'-phosphate oxidase family protein [Clostridia bacterium]|nr:pyridoxamine 5'-phosphate oxidase family protein [Clostridia bacterium]
MEKHECLNKVEDIIEDAQTAILATVDEEGRPRMRWMTPTTLKGRQGCIYTVAAKGSNKLMDLQQNEKVQWMIQSKDLDRIINIKGFINVIDNPSMRTEIMEAIGKRLNVFWKVNLKDTEFVVLETILEEAVYSEPMKGKVETICFREGDL